MVLQARSQATVSSGTFAATESRAAPGMMNPPITKERRRDAVSAQQDKLSRSAFSKDKREYITRSSQEMSSGQLPPVFLL